MMWGNGNKRHSVAYSNMSSSAALRGTSSLLRLGVVFVVAAAVVYTTCMLLQMTMQPGLDNRVPSSSDVIVSDAVVSDGVASVSISQRSSAPMPNLPGYRFHLDPPTEGCESRPRYYTTKMCGCVREIRNGASSANQESTCGADATARGMGQRVVAFTFFGNPHDRDIRGYYSGIEGNALTMPEFYPGWTMRVYHNLSLETDEIAKKRICDLECRFPFLDFCQAAEIPGYGNLANWTAAAWRYLPLGDALVSAFVSRDLDSRFLERESAAVAEWLASGKTWHTMRDHPSMVVLKILAGMWGANLDAGKREFLKDLLADIIDMPVSHEYGRDQTILSDRIWPIIHGDSVRHESYDCQQMMTPDVRPWPTRREDKPYNYVGVRQRVDPTPLRDPCPIECRPKEHKDWTSC